MIGILGGYGDIGTWVTYFLDQYGSWPLKIGGRHPKKNLRLLNPKHNIQYNYVNINEDTNLKEFVCGCEVIINCTGIQGKPAMHLAQITQEAKCNYIDLSMCHELKSLEIKQKGQSIIYGCGSLPGLAEVLTFYLSKQFSKVKDLKFYYGAQGVISNTAAKDYLDAVISNNSRSMVWWEDNQVKPYVKFNELQQKLPFEEGTFKLFPYVDKSACYVAKELGLETGKWYMAFSGKRTLEVLEQARMGYERDPQYTIKQLHIASEIDCYEMGKYAGFVIEMSGFEEGKSEIIHKTLYLQLDDPSKLTGFSVAAIALAMKKQIFNQGIYPLYACGKAVELVQDMETLDVFHICIAQGDSHTFCEEVIGEI